ncbi:DUF4362 domain-containing protein [Lysinibacillus sp. Ag94]|uniref:DUF4362 domain-containing protein n=1 Tax=Lysinibacillus sp. Ag94 TaxID=2936682 RepID=UPI00200ECED0|nr:DUF4362 domain-containing protein [Lysinibacillus sp. Ag94]UPW84636.1 DUF4362 domain-containing protein [Lysinibacillus sp. Ag94]
MKKIYVLFFILIIYGCDVPNKSHDIKMDPDIFPYPELLEDTTDKQGEIENKERFEKFHNNVQQNKTDNIRLVRYTPEGNLVFYYLEYQNEMIYLTIDTKSNINEQKSLIQTTCISLKKVQMNISEKYLLEGCDKPIDNNILIIEKY